MHRIPVAVLATLAALSATSAIAQTSWDQLTPVQVLSWPKNYFNAGLHYSGKVTVTFGNVGNIPLDTSAVGTDATSVISRNYSDGNVSLDSRTDDAGNKTPDDGRTNTWSYSYASQVSSDQSSISFHSYYSTSNGATALASNGATSGLDLEYSRRVGSFGRAKPFREQPYGWGVLFGFSGNDIRAHSSATLTATLHTLTDTYSLLGATPPQPGYTAPSSTTVGNETVDTTTLLANLPDTAGDRTTDDKSTVSVPVKGFWEVHGAYYTMRAGAWFRWQPKPNMAIRATAGVSGTVLGVGMRYNEVLDFTNLVESSATVSNSGQTKDFAYAIPGGFGSIDFEYWLTYRTGIFASITYERFQRKITLPTTIRTANINVSSGIGMRLGMTTRF